MSSFAISRSRVIDAPAETLFPLVDDFHRWTAWSPWEGLDPQMERTYAGPDRGVGARYTWRGNRKAGSGSMEILESVPHTRIHLRLEFSRPMKAVNPTTFTFDAAGPGSTRVTWTMTGENRGLGRIFALVVPMDKLVGKDFEKGLDQLAIAAAGSAPGDTGRAEDA
ncbi:potassium-transporting ATPase subunit F [Tersicoccus solisilvae]|uniref:Potassium-transporting ATPase subunit F n=1 Tax=Tersicoccus solisilvae TaxID=1882339 RepID=A0ABQ1NRA0_9MICC|nr:SRPBCC family protein [Tersicoccus solisilvae]GGC83502.1 potassium-transporting ATPase subunit F [Tersicoccus solisilvae]